MTEKDLKQYTIYPITRPRLWEMYKLHQESNWTA